MFSVEWLKNGEVVRDEAVMGNDIYDVIEVAAKLTPVVVEELSERPDEVRITDYSRGEGLIFTLDRLLESAHRT